MPVLHIKSEDEAVIKVPYADFRYPPTVEPGTLVVFTMRRMAQISDTQLKTMQDQVELVKMVTEKGGSLYRDVVDWPHFPEGWAPLKALGNPRVDWVPPGGSHHDPLAQHISVSIQMDWLCRYTG